MGELDRSHGWSFNAIIGILGAFLGIGAAVGIPAMVFWSLKSNGAYRQGMDIARKDPAVIELLGSPVEGGFFVIGRTQGFLGGSEMANLRVSISGPRAHGTLYVFGEKPEDGAWRVERMSIDVGRQRVLRWDGSHPEDEGFQP
jgi:hypothetical protein